MIIKHNTPCGVGAGGRRPAEAFALARDATRSRAFGGIVALNREVDAAAAQALAETFLECVIAPGLLARRPASCSPRRRTCGCSRARASATRAQLEARPEEARELRSVTGGVLVQDRDLGSVRREDCKVVTRRAPTEEEWQALRFAWKVCKHVKSNAIVFAAGDRTLAVGGGQTSRVESVKIARHEGPLPAGRERGGAPTPSSPSATASSEIARAGATAIIQPGGSVRDAEVIAAADEPGWPWCSPGCATSGTSRAQTPRPGRPPRPWYTAHECESWSSAGAGGSTRSPGRSRQSPLAAKVFCAPGQPRHGAPGRERRHRGRRRRRRWRAGRPRAASTSWWWGRRRRWCRPRRPAGRGGHPRLRRRPPPPPQLEGSKAFAKEVMAAAGIPTAALRGPSTRSGPRSPMPARPGGRVVVKADGLAAGKGVVVCGDVAEAEAALRDILVDRDSARPARGSWSRSCSPARRRRSSRSSTASGAWSCPPAQDHKRVFDGDRGPNTGGMGAFCPRPGGTPRSSPSVERRVLLPTVREHGAARDARSAACSTPASCSRPTGPKVLEFNARFGDPETQPILMRARGRHRPGAARPRRAATSRRRRSRSIPGPRWAWSWPPGLPGRVTAGDAIDGAEAAVPAGRAGLPRRHAARPGRAHRHRRRPGAHRLRAGRRPRRRGGAGLRGRRQSSSAGTQFRTRHRASRPGGGCMSPKVLILMGSDSDWEVMSEARKALEELGVETEVHVSSRPPHPDAHRRRWPGRPPGAASRWSSAAPAPPRTWPGVVAAETELPVLGVPLASSDLAGLDALLATAQMPGGRAGGHAGRRQGGGAQRRAARGAHPRPAPTRRWRSGSGSSGAAWPARSRRRTRPCRRRLQSDKKA